MFSFDEARWVCYYKRMSPTRALKTLKTTTGDLLDLIRRSTHQPAPPRLNGAGGTDDACMKEEGRGSRVAQAGR